jgi:O-acetyl-ADP-ribose deacetylase
MKTLYPYLFIGLLLGQSIQSLAFDKKKYQVGQSTIVLLKGNITEQGSDKPEATAIVNAANVSLIGSAGVAKAIQDAAGKELVSYIEKEIKPIGINAMWGNIRCNVGNACITPAFKLTKNGIGKIIHTVGPDLRDSNQNKQKEQLLRNTYRHSLECAKESGITTLSFPALSTGIFGYHIEEATPIAIDEVAKFLQVNPHWEVRFVVTADNYPIYEKHIQDL